MNYGKLIFGLIISVMSILSQAQTVYQKQMDIAIRNDDLKTAKAMLAKGAFATDLSTGAFVARKPETIKFLLDNGFDIRDDSELYTSLFSRSSDKQLFEKVKLFLDRGVSPYGRQGERKRTTLYEVTRTYAREYDDYTLNGRKAFSYFVKNTTDDINKGSPDGGVFGRDAQCRPIDIVYGLHRGRLSDVAKIFIDAGTDLDACSCVSASTPLMNAVRYDDKVMVNYILSKRPNINAVCNNSTVLNVVQRQPASQSMIDLELMLVDKGAKTKSELGN